MTALPSTISESPTIEQGLNSMLHDVKAKACSTFEDCEERVKQSPAKAVLIAVAAGYCLHRLPVRSLLVSQVRLMAALAPPALLAVGAAKLCEFLQSQARR
ncbi:MAG: hypothetical protein V4819_26465 [Verrucomicrobiota bacterium]